MNKNNYRLVFNRVRGMLIAVEETANASGRGDRWEPVAVARVSHRLPRFVLRRAAFVVLIAVGATPLTGNAQVMGSGAHAPSVIQTPNGLPQVNINKPGGGGVSLNSYSRFDVQKPGVIVNNSPVMTSTQQAGYINGNPNFGANDAARVIVNQVNSNNPSQLRGFVEIAGQRAEMIISNPSGLVVDGGGFINTSRAILTTGTPNLNADGSLAGFNVAGGLITVQGAGLNAANVDQVDLISRTMQANAAIHASNLNVVTGANHVDHETLRATRIQGEGAAPAVAIDVGQLGGMYSNRIFLVGTEGGVGVRNAGTIAADAMGLTLSMNGRLMQTGKLSSLGNIAVSAAAGIDNSGTIYAGQSVSLETGADVMNAGTLAAQHGVDLRAGTLNSTGTLGAGVNGDGAATEAGDLRITTAGQLNATGRNIAGGNVSATGTGVNLASGTTAANGDLSLSAATGDVNLANAITSARGAVTAKAAGAIVNDHGKLRSGGATKLSGGTVSNQGGSVSSQGLLSVAAVDQIANQTGTLVSAGKMALHGGKLANNRGTIQSAGHATVEGAAIDNTAGRITSLNADGLQLSATGLLTNAAGATASGAQGGVIGGNGDVTIQGGWIDNRATITSNTNLHVSGQSLDNDGGTLQAAKMVSVDASEHLSNSGGAIVGQAASLGGKSLDNSAGRIEADRLALRADELVNHGGTITQNGTDAMTVEVSGTFDNSNGGTLQTNSIDLTLAPTSLVNDEGTITHGGTGTLTIEPSKGTNALNNVSVTIVTKGHARVDASSWNNAAGVFAAQRGVTENITGDVNNVQGLIRAGASLSLVNGGALQNQAGHIQAGQRATGDASTLTVKSASIDNADGAITHLGRGKMDVRGDEQISNSHAGGVSGMGMITGNGDVTILASSILNTQGGQLSGANLRVQGTSLDNSGGQIGSVLATSGDVDVTINGVVTNIGGQIGSNRDLTLSAATLRGGGAYSAARDASLNMQGDFSTTPDAQFNAGHDFSFTSPGTFSNGASVQAVNDLSVNASNIVNSGTMMAGGLLHTQSGDLDNTGSIVGGSTSIKATGTVSNLGPTALIGASDSQGTLEILARDIENRDDSTATDAMATTAILGMGKLVLAGGKDTAGHYTNAALVNNASALIQSGDDMQLHADKLTNKRRVMSNSTGSIDPATLVQFGVPIEGRTGRINVKDPNSIGGVYPQPPREGHWNSDYHFTTYYADSATATTVTRLSPAAQIVSGGGIDASSMGTLQNYWSDIAAVGNFQMPQHYDSDGWAALGQQAPSVTVFYSGQYHYNNYNNEEHDWQLPFGNAPFVTRRPGGYAQAAPASVKEYSLPDYGSTLGVNGAISGTGVSINNTAANASLPPLGLLPGQAVQGLTFSEVSGQGASVNGGPMLAVDPVVAGATAQNVLNNLAIPRGGLYRPNPSPSASYVIETNPAFTNQKNFISSDDFFSQIGVDLTHIPKRLGDGFYEQQLVRNEVTALTGKAVIGPYTDLQTMYQSLMAAGAGMAKSLDLPVGASLSADQVSRLTSNVIMMETRVVDGQSVLVPVVYLAQARRQNVNGPLIAATDIDLKDTEDFTNSGTLKADNMLSIQGRQIDAAFGALQSGGLMLLTTIDNVDLTSAKVKAGRLKLDAGEDLILDTATDTVARVSRDGATSMTTTLGPTARLEVTGDASITTGGSFQQHAGALSVGGNLGMKVGGDWDLGAVQTGEHKIVRRAHGVSNTDVNQMTSSSVKVGGRSSIGVVGDLGLKGAQIDLGQGGTIAAKGHVTLGAASATSTVNSNSSSRDSHGSSAQTLHTSDQALTGTLLRSGAPLRSRRARISPSSAAR